VNTRKPVIEGMIVVVAGRDVRVLLRAKAARIEGAGAIRAEAAPEAAELRRVLRQKAAARIRILADRIDLRASYRMALGELIPTCERCE
jgi:hypothetical protein